MPENPCEPGYPVPTACRDAAAVPWGCAERADCIYGSGQSTEPWYPCAMTDNGDDTRCDGAKGPPAFRRDRQPWFCLAYGDGFADAEGNAEPFYNRRWNGDEIYRYILNADAVFWVWPCAPTNYCPMTDPYYDVWLTRWFVTGAGWLDGKNWKLFCNPVEWSPDHEAEQLVGKPIYLDLDRSLFQPAFVHLVAGQYQPNCFEPFLDVFCFSEFCEAPEWSCIGASEPARARALDSLYVTLNLSYSADNDAFPFDNPYEITLKNCALAMLNWIVDRMDDAHDPRCAYDSQAKCTWSHREVFDESNLTLPGLELEPWPAVRGFAPPDVPEGLYPEYAGVPVPITCQGLLTKVELPAVLTLKMVTIVMHLHVQNESGGDDGYRVMGDCFVALILRVKLLPKAFAVEWPLQLRGRPDALDDPFNLEAEDPAHPYVDPLNPGQAHAHEILTPVGPNGERIWLEQTWRGLLSAPEFSRNSNEFVVVDEASTAACCQALHAVDRTTIPGEINDCSELQADGTRVIRPQRYQGWVGLGVDFGGVTGGCRP